MNEIIVALIPGGADRSYGIEVAKLAGLPDKVVQQTTKSGVYDDHIIMY